MTVDRDELKQAVERVADIVSAKTTEARLWLAEGALAVTDVEINAKVRTMLPGVGGPPEARLALNARYFIQAMASLDGDRVEIHIPPGPHAPAWFCAPGEAEDRIIIVPVLVDWGREVF